MSEEVIGNIQFGEQLSALMDGELARDQVRFLLRGVEHESDLARRWSSYHLISATLKREFVAVALPATFAAGVLDRLDVAPAGASRRHGLGALRWVGGGAIAAAVAVVALVVSRPVGDNGAMAGTAAGAVVAQQVPTRQARSPYLPMLSQPPASISSPLPMEGINGFRANDVLPASLDSVLPSYYSPRGDLLSRNDLTSRANPYVLYVRPAPAAQTATPPAQAAQK